MPSQAVLDGLASWKEESLQNRVGLFLQGGTFKLRCRPPGKRPLALERENQHSKQGLRVQSPGPQDGQHLALGE